MNVGQSLRWQDPSGLVNSQSIGPSFGWTQMTPPLNGRLEISGKALDAGEWQTEIEARRTPTAADTAQRRLSGSAEGWSALRRGI